MVRLHPYPAVIIAQPCYERNKIFILLRSSGLNQRRGAGPGERIRALPTKYWFCVVGLSDPSPCVFGYSYSLNRKE